MLESEVLRTSNHIFERCGDFFEQNPIQTNVIVTGVEGNDSVRLIRVGNGQTSGVALRTTDGYIIAVANQQAVAALAAALPETAAVMRLVGEVSVVAALAGVWSERTGGSIETVDLHRVYRLNQLVTPHSDGRLRRAIASDLDLIAQWLADFADETGFAATKQEALVNARSMLDLQSVYFWVDNGRPVAQLRASPDRYGVSRIGMVYTPPSDRGHGYAAGLTAAVAATQQARSGVQEVTLFTQAANAGANRLYCRLGFESVSNTIVLDVAPPAPKWSAVT